MLKKTARLRLIVICMAAASVGLSMALISIAKLLLLLAAFGAVTSVLLNWRARHENPIQLTKWTPLVVAIILAMFALSLLWTSGPPADAFGSLAKYGKLLAIVVMMVLIRSPREAKFALGSFVAAQAFLMISSWMLYFHLPVPWATSNMALTEHAVFSSYLDQGIITAVAGAIFWHLRSVAPGRHGHRIAMVLAAACMANVFFVLSGRTGHVVALALLSIAIMWELPRRHRPLMLLLPFVIAGALFASSAKFRERLTQVKTEVQSYSSSVQQVSSSGVRLALWTSSLQMIAGHPVVGSGVGSWSTEYNDLEHRKHATHADAGGNFNPHQEYLLWGVQLGFIGMLLLIGLMLAVLADASRMSKPAARAAQSAVVALAAACMFNSSIYDALIGDFFCVTIGLLLAFGLQDSSRVAAAIDGAPNSDAA